MTREIPLSNWESVVREFEGPRLVGDWLFRGQHDCSWNLQTSLERHTPPHIAASGAEPKLLFEFKRRAHFYLQPQLIPAGEDTGEWLALMQHFGAPTRLLDATRSPYLALYFAVEDVTEVEACSVWAIDRTWCHIAAGEAIFRQVPSARTQIEAQIGSGKRYPVGTPPAMAQGLDSSRLRGDIWRKNAVTVVVPYEPLKLSQRLSIQQGAFLVPRQVDVSFMDNLSALGDFGNHVLKYRIPYNQRGRILERLRVMNITREQLFPGMDGFAQSFQQFLFGETDEQRNDRAQTAALEVAVHESIRVAEDPQRILAAADGATTVGQDETPEK